MSPKILLLSIFLLFASCVKDVDFDQSDDLSIQPTYVASLIHFTFDQNKFVGDVGNLPLTITESSSAPLNTSSIANEQLIKAEIQFKVSNLFNRTFIVILRFYDALGNLTFSFNPVTILPNTSNSVQIQTIQGADLNNFVKSQYVSMEVVLMPSSDGSVINQTLQKSLNVQVSGAFQFNFSN